VRIGLVVPHIFMHREILPNVIFSPGTLALRVAEGVDALGVELTLFTPGPVDTKVRNITADLSLFDNELSQRGDKYTELLKKHPFTFVSLARQVQAELLATAFAMANDDQLDLVHIYTNEEEIALPFAQFCTKPVVFSHHDPFNFLIKYRSIFPKYPQLNWLSFSLAQRQAMPLNTNWVGNIYHGVEESMFTPNYAPQGGYVAYFGRIIEPKGVHLAIQAVASYNRTAKKPLMLKIAGKHYSGHAKDTYWTERIQPYLGQNNVEYLGFIDNNDEKQAFLGNARALIVPSLFEEPFGMVMIEAMACGTPLLGLDSGAISEVITPGVNGFVVHKRQIKKSARHAKHSAHRINDTATATALANKLDDVLGLDRKECRYEFEKRFTARKMCEQYVELYRALIESPDRS
jgi:glycosyltransferase involved in cell wall biosynthesis